MNKYEDFKWFLSMASKYAPDFEFRALPKNSTMPFVMCRRPTDAPVSEPATPNTLWVPLVVMSSGGSKDNGRRFDFHAKSWPLRSGASAVVAVCVDHQLMWCLTACDIPPRTIYLDGKYESSLLKGEAAICSSLSDRLDCALSLPTLRSETWADWIVESNQSRTHEASRKLLRRLVSIAPFDSMLRFAFEHHATFNATLMGRRIMLRHAMLRENRTLRSIALHHQIDGVSGNTYHLEDDFDFLVVILARSGTKDIPGRIGIVSKQRLHEMGFLRDREGQAGCIWMTLSWTGSIFCKKNPIDCSECFIDADETESEMRDFVVKRLWE